MTFEVIVSLISVQKINFRERSGKHLEAAGREPMCNEFENEWKNKKSMRVKLRLLEKKFQYN